MCAQEVTSPAQAELAVPGWDPSSEGLVAPGCLAALWRWLLIQQTWERDKGMSWNSSWQWLAGAPSPEKFSLVLMGDNKTNFVGAAIDQLQVSSKQNSSSIPCRRGEEIICSVVWPTGIRAL